MAIKRKKTVNVNSLERNTKYYIKLIVAPIYNINCKIALILGVTVENIDIHQFIK